MEDHAKAKTVSGIISKLDPEKRKIVEKLRVLVKKALPHSEEIVKWGNITYLVEGKNISWIIMYKDHLDFGFFKGAQLKSNRLEGTGKGLRHIKVRGESDIDGPEFTRLLKEAANLKC
jgi:hypothetical protein